MVPDFEYFLRFAPRGGFGHRVPGVFLFDIPAAIIALWLFHAYAKEPLYNWLPESIQARIQLGPSALPVRNFAQLMLLLISILIGVATHLLWDSFTHPGFWPYQHWQFLHRTVQLPVVGTLRYLRVIQHVSTFIGAAVLALWFRHWFRRTPPMHHTPRKHPRTALFVICTMALLAAALRGFLILRWVTPLDFNRSKFLFEGTIITTITVFWLGVLMYGVLRAIARSRTRNA